MILNESTPSGKSNFMNDSHNLKNVLANLRSGGSNVRRASNVNESAQRRQTINQLNEDGLKIGNFYENQFTPKTALIQ